MGKNKGQTKTVVYSGGSSRSSSSTTIGSSNKKDEPIGFKKSAPVPAKQNGHVSTVYGGSSGNYGSGNYKSGGNGSSYGGSYVVGGSPHMSPTKAFEFNGIEFWGSAKSKLESFAFQDGDVVINCTGTAIHVKPFIKSMPEWFSQKEIPGGKPPEVLLDWPDFKTPPLSFKLDFWKGMIDAFQANGVNRVLICCMAGQGRTGTALSAFALATGAVQDHKHAISLIRTEYSSHAVESNDQEMYLEYLVATSGAFFFEDKEEEAEYYKEFYDDFYGAGKEKIDLGQFVGSDIDDIIEWFEERDSDEE